MATVSRKPKARPKSKPGKGKISKSAKPPVRKKVASVAKAKPRPPAAKRPAAGVRPTPKKPAASLKHAPQAATAPPPAAARPRPERKSSSRAKAAQRTTADVMAAMSLHRLTHLAATDWDDLMSMADMDGVLPYAMKGTFTRGEVIRHKAFGLGIVVREMGVGKIQVSFRDGVRLLVCNRSK
jgi:hypothetical protein